MKDLLLSFLLLASIDNYPSGYTERLPAVVLFVPPYKGETNLEPFFHDIDIHYKVLGNNVVQHKHLNRNEIQNFYNTQGLAIISATIAPHSSVPKEVLLDHCSCIGANSVSRVIVDIEGDFDIKSKTDTRSISCKYLDCM